MERELRLTLREQAAALGKQQPPSPSPAVAQPHVKHSPSWWLGLLAPGSLGVQLPDLGDWI